MDLKHRAAIVVGCASLLVVTGRNESALGQEAGVKTATQSASVDCDPRLSEQCAKRRLRRAADCSTPRSLVETAAPA
jgi:hypothetical protein